MALHIAPRIRPQHLDGFAQLVNPSEPPVTGRQTLLQFTRPGQTCWGTAYQGLGFSQLLLQVGRPLVQGHHLRTRLFTMLDDFVLPGPLLVRLLQHRL